MSVPNAVNTVIGNGEILQPVCSKRCKYCDRKRRNLTACLCQTLQGTLQILALPTVTSRNNHNVPLCRPAVGGGSVRTRRDCGTTRDRRRPASSVDVASFLTRYTNCHLYSAQGSVYLQCLYQYQSTRRHNPPDHNMNSHRHQNPISRATHSNNSNNSTLHYALLVKH
jgi:hypothetical protein